MTVPGTISSILRAPTRGVNAAVVVAAACAAGISSTALAQSYPTKAIRIVVTSPPGGSQDFLARLLAQSLTPALADVIGGQIDAIMADVHLVAPHERSGRLRVLAVTSIERSSVIPGAPTVAEGGIRGYSAGTWFGLFAPASTPKPIIARLNEEVRKILADPSLRDRLSTQGIMPQPSTPEQLGDHLRTEIAKWRKVVQSAGIRVE